MDHQQHAAARLSQTFRTRSARLLCERTRDISVPASGFGKVAEIIAPGNVVITSNWDLFVEYDAARCGIPLRLGGQPGDSHVTLLKLHGSVDWTEATNRRRGSPDADFAVLRQVQNPPRRRRILIEADPVLRIQAVENMSRSWQFIKARTARPLMVTMSLGKTADVKPILSMWEDAYYALSATRHLRIIGYSMPADDIEIRTLLRAGVARGATSNRAAAAQVTVINPETRVHERVRTLVSRNARSDYGASARHSLRRTVRLPLRRRPQRIALVGRRPWAVSDAAKRSSGERRSIASLRGGCVPAVLD